MKLAKLSLSIVLLVACNGCVGFKECIDNCIIDCRNECYAECAWLRCKSNYCDVDYKCDFGRGFRDGYIAVASGGGLCPPALPPERYWHFEYQNPTGQDQMLAWFNG